jgi:hypothetical protein
VQSGRTRNPFPIAAKAASRLSIDALVEKNSSKSTTQIVGTKRKADEISSTPEELTYSPSFSQSSNAGIDLENTSLPDAQPRDVSDLAVQASSSQSTETSSKHSYSTASMVTQEVRPKKGQNYRKMDWHHNGAWRWRHRC